MNEYWTIHIQHDKDSAWTMLYKSKEYPPIETIRRYATLFGINNDDYTPNGGWQHWVGRGYPVLWIIKWPIKELAQLPDAIV